ncbi:MAG: hypothetical protein Hyperionvirus37_3 [Hyperionvirus sp.]|uniref:Uncharacterized protein n=1 Tax=Hyperionvirus sp. TaxID=2487770 RepID=A0A3G5AC19_9VIRU|nr:MAG: hypothetical protein Hyperionvirus37_3 [Hyperionvirus sp.]
MDVQKNIDEYMGKKERNILEDGYPYRFGFSKLVAGDEHLVDIYEGEKHILKGVYEVLGCYNLVSSIWVWGWNISQVERDLVRESKKVRKYSRRLVDEGVITKDVEEYYFYGTTGSFFIAYNKLDRLLRYSEYVLGCEKVVGRKMGGDNLGLVEFIVLKKIIQLSA